MKNLYTKLKNIKLLVLDFDGVFTDGGIYVDSKSKDLRRFDVKDGLAIKLVQKININIAIISGSNSKIIDERAKSLGIKIVKKGMGAYYSSGSRPNQSGSSWGIARLASSITGGKAAAVDYKILEEGCKKGSRALNLARKSRKKHGYGKRKVPKTK